MQNETALNVSSEYDTGFINVTENLECYDMIVCKLTFTV